MSSTVRVFAVGWFVTGLGLAIVGVLDLMDESIKKHGRFWSVPLLPVVTLATAWGAVALARGLWLESSYVAVLGRAMSVPLFAIAIWLLVSGASLLAIGGLDAVAGLYLGGGVLILVATVLNYRVAQRIEA